MLGRLLKTLSGRKRDDTSGHTPTPAATAEIPNSMPDLPAIPGLPFLIRPLVSADLPHLANVFRRAIDTLAARDYDDSQRQAWQASADEDAFLQALQQGVTIVADNEGTPVAFAQLHPADHLRMLYVDPEWAELGIATLLYQYLEDEARIIGSKHLDTASSLTAERFFKGMGFTAEAEESVTRAGVTLPRLRMRKTLVK